MVWKKQLEGNQKATVGSAWYKGEFSGFFGSGFDKWRRLAGGANSKLKIQNVKLFGEWK
jgi:hypothetical protein